MHFPTCTPDGKLHEKTVDKIQPMKFKKCAEVELSQQIYIQRIWKIPDVFGLRILNKTIQWMKNLNNLYLELLLIILI